LLSKIARSQVLLAEYDIVFITRKAIKRSVIANHLVDHVMEDYKLLNFNLPDKYVLVVEDDKEVSDWRTLYFDGAVNVSGNETGEVIISPKKKQYPRRQIKIYPYIYNDDKVFHLKIRCDYVQCFYLIRNPFLSNS
jgi:hypothetical protein